MPSTPETIESALADYHDTFRDPRWQEYLDFHRRRYLVLMTLAMNLLDSVPTAQDGARRILDVGPRFEVDMFHRLVPGLRVDTLGLNAGLFPARDNEQRVVFDLNYADDAEQRPALGPYPLIVMAEVVEHLHMPPSVVLGWIGSLLAPGGYLLVQTPNAVALPYRLRMLAGKNPFGQLSADRAYPGHIREYTTAELVREGRSLGLEVAKLTTANYFASGKLSNRLFQRFERIVPGTLRAGITVAYRAPVAAPLGGG